MYDPNGADRSNRNQWMPPPPPPPPSSSSSFYHNQHHHHPSFHGGGGAGDYGYAPAHSNQGNQNFNLDGGAASGTSFRRRAGAVGASPQILKMYGNNQSGIGNSNANSFGSSSAKMGGGGQGGGGGSLSSMSFSKTLIFAGIYTLLVFLLTRFYSEIKCREQVRQVRRGTKESSLSVSDNSKSGDRGGDLKLTSPSLSNPYPYDDDGEESLGPLELNMITSMMHSSLPLVSNVHYSSRLVVIITPTYIRPFQFAHVTMLANTLRAAKALGLRFVWIVIEEVSGFYPLDESAEFTKSASIYTSVPPTMVTSTLLKNVAFDLDYQLLAVEQSGSFSNENAQGHRGVLQRNLGLDVIAHENYQDAAVYFADDDNHYDLRVFSEIQKVVKLGVFPVGMPSPEKKLKPDLSGMETPICEDNKVMGWISGFNGGGERIFKSDMAGFCFNSSLLWEQGPSRPPGSPPPSLVRSPVRFSFKSAKGMLETDFITHLIEPGPNESHESEMEVLADGCTNVFVWHQDGKSEPKGSSLRFPLNWRVEQPLSKCQKEKMEWNPLLPNCV